jgi:ABC-type lipoprotein export system ATPase subunit
VVVGEAISLAIAILNCRKSGRRWRSLFRDETAGALDPANAQKYVDMMRRALDLGGFANVIFVAHQPEVWERADVQLHIQGGQVIVGGLNAARRVHQTAQDDPAASAPRADSGALLAEGREARA